jgi:tape measure domain-containing protein
MNRVYEFMMRLQDMVSPQMLKMASTYGKVIGSMERRKSVIGNVFSSAAQSADSLRRKMLGLSDTPAKLRVDTSQVDAASSKVNRLRDAMGRFLPGMGGGGSGGASGGGIGRMMRGTALGGMMLGGIGGYLGMQGVQALNSSFIQPAFASERTQFSTGVMLGDMQTGKALMDQLAKYAADNPVFDKPEVQASGQLLVGVNEQLKNIVPRLSMFGDVAAGSGNDLMGLTTIIAKIKAQGRVQGDEMMQLMERRINVLPALASVKGVRQADITKLITKGLVSYEDVIAAFAKMTGEGGTYHNMGSRMAAETHTGQYQKVMGNISEIQTQLGTKMLPYVTQIMTFVGELMSNIGVLGDGFSDLQTSIYGVWLLLRDLFESLGFVSDKSSTAQAIIQTLSTTLSYFGNVIQFITGVLNAFVSSPLAMAITAIGTAKYVWLALNAAFVASPIGFIITLVVGLAAALMTAYDKVDWFREGLIKMWETAKSIFSNMGDFFKMILTGNVMGAVGVLARAMGEAKVNGQNAVVADRNQRLAKNNSKPFTGYNQTTDSPFAMAGSPGTGGGKSLSEASGLNSTVEGSKSKSISIHIDKMIEKSEINVMDLDGDASALESKVLDLLARIIRSSEQLQLG